MMKRIAMVLVLCAEVAARGQLSPEDAAKRMEELAQRAATRPVDGERARLVRENADLRKQATELLRQVSALQAKLNQLQSAATTKPSAKEIRKGMTIRDAEVAMGTNAVLQGENDDGTNTYTIVREAESHGDGQATSLTATYHHYTVRTKNNIVVSYDMRIEYVDRPPAGIAR